MVFELIWRLSYGKTAQLGDMRNSVMNHVIYIYVTVVTPADGLKGTAEGVGRSPCTGMQMEGFPRNVERSSDS